MPQPARTRWTTSLATLSVLVAGAAASAGCSGADAPAPAPPSYTGTSAICRVSDPEGELIVHPVTLTASAGLTLEGVSLVGADNLEIVESAVVRFDGNPRVTGVIDDYPPQHNAGIADGLADWDTRAPLAGHTLTAAEGPQAVLVAVRLVDPGRPGHLVGVHLDDSSGGRDLTKPVLVEPHGTVCTVDDYAGTTAWAPLR